jgi:hypothetical protein
VVYYLGKAEHLDAYVKAAVADDDIGVDEAERVGT